jgi:hypothetical protein
VGGDPHIQYFNRHFGFVRSERHDLRTPRHL